VTPPEDRSLFLDQLDRWGLAGEWTIVDQGDGDLGRRMNRWFETTLAGDLSATAPDESAAAILIGADCPSIDASVIADAGDRLADADVVLGPAADGGYYLIGMHARSATWSDLASLFVDVPWSTDRVLSVTVANCKTVGLRVAMLGQREDIDTIDELNRLRRSLADEAGSDSDRTLGGSIESVLQPDFPFPFSPVDP
jgi:hypothetical protein